MAEYRGYNAHGESYDDEQARSKEASEAGGTMSNMIKRLQYLANLQAEYEKACVAEAADEIARLRERAEMWEVQAGILYKDASDWRARAERLAHALRMIAGETRCIDSLMSDKDIARAALDAEAS